MGRTGMAWKNQTMASLENAATLFRFPTGDAESMKMKYLRWNLFHFMTRQEELTITKELSRNNLWRLRRIVRDSSLDNFQKVDFL